MKALRDQLEKQKKECQDTIASLKAQYEREIKNLHTKHDDSVSKLQTMHEENLNKVEKELEKENESLRQSLIETKGVCSCGPPLDAIVRKIMEKGMEVICCFKVSPLAFFTKIGFDF